MNAEFFQLWRQTFELTTGAKVLTTLPFKRGVWVIYWRHGLHATFIKRYD